MKKATDKEWQGVLGFLIRSSNRVDDVKTKCFFLLL